MELGMIGLIRMDKNKVQRLRYPCTPSSEGIKYAERIHSEEALRCKYDHSTGNAYMAR